jgi:hypothetical protein
MKCRLLLCSILWLSSSSALSGQGTPGTFSFTGSMSVQREQASATLITGCNCPADGKVLVAGGVIDGVSATTNTAELYDPATRAFTPTGTVNVARSGQAAALLPGGKVLIVGAFDSSGPSDAEIYDPVAGMFSCVAGVDPLTGNCNATLVNNSSALIATTLQSGKVLVTGLQTPTSGGQASTAAAIFDPIQASFTCVSGISSTPLVCNPSMNNPHTSGTATLLKNGQVLVAGGADRNVGDTNLAEIYDPTIATNGGFVAAGTLLTTRANHAAVLLKTGEVLVVGGGNESGNFNTAEVFANGSFAAVGTMAHVRLSPTATLLNDGTALITGGCCEVSNLQLASAEIYSPGTKTFVPTGNMNEARATHTATLLPSGQVLVAGGFFDLTAELYTPVSGGAPPPPSITSVLPNIGIQGQIIANVTVIGTHFATTCQPNLSLSFSGPGVVVSSCSSTPTQITADISIAGVATPGPSDVTVTNPDGQKDTRSGAFTIALAAPLATPAISVSTTSLDFSSFGPVHPNGSKLLILTVYNRTIAGQSGTAPLEIKSYGSSNPFSAFSGQLLTSPLIGPGQSADIGVTFSPTAGSTGTVKGLLQIDSNAGAISVELTGIAATTSSARPVLLSTDRCGKVSCMQPPIDIQAKYFDSAGNPIRAPRGWPVNADIIITNLTGTWYDLSVAVLAGTASAPTRVNFNPAQIPNSFPIAPNSYVRFPVNGVHLKFNQGDYLQFEATDKDFYVGLLFTLDMGVRGLLGVPLVDPSGAAASSFVILSENQGKVPTACAGDATQAVQDFNHLDIWAGSWDVVGFVGCAVDDPVLGPIVTDIISRALGPKQASTWVTKAPIIAEIAQGAVFTYNFFNLMIPLGAANLYSPSTGEVRVEAALPQH